MLRKFFPLDKNYILEQAQLSLEKPLLHYLLDFVKVEYLIRTNPLGLADELSEKIRQHQVEDFRHLHEFYVTLMGVFRYIRYGDNQLEFLFDGSDDYQKYQGEWAEQFKKWSRDFCTDQSFLRAVLDLTVFFPVDSPIHLVDNRLSGFIARHFSLRFETRGSIRLPEENRAHHENHRRISKLR